MAAPIPQNLTLAQGNSTVLASWDAVVGSTSYTLQRSTDNVTFVTIASPTVNRYVDTAVVTGTQYYYKVAATGTLGLSLYTPSQSIVPTTSGNMTLGQVRLAAQQRADMNNSPYISDSEWNSYINQSYFELYDLLVTTFEDYYAAAPLSIPTDGVTSQYPLPNGVNYSAAPSFYKLLGVDCGLGGGNNAYQTVHKFDFIERNRYVYPSVTSTFLGVFNLRYRLLANSLMLIPTPAAGQYIRLWYVPRLATLVSDNDQLDGVSGWTEYVIVDAAIKAMQKEESDVSVLMAQKQALIDRIQATAMNRDIGSPDTISNTRDSGGGWGNGSDGSFGGY